MYFMDEVTRKGLLAIAKDLYGDPCGVTQIVGDVWEIHTIGGGGAADGPIRGDYAEITKEYIKRKHENSRRAENAEVL